MTYVMTQQEIQEAKKQIKRELVLDHLVADFDAKLEQQEKKAAQAVADEAAQATAPPETPPPSSDPKHYGFEIPGGVTW